ncbi:MAG: VWA domain-containing protein [Planctomycetales bacterium]|nr:VWA domain-containing protein [Planctomycetales bacterium]
MSQADANPICLVEPGADRPRAGRSALLVSFLVHLLLLIGFSLLTTNVSDALPDLVLTTPTADEIVLDETPPEEFHFDIEPAEAIGAAALGGLQDTLVAGQLPEPDPPQVALLDPMPADIGTFDAREAILAATGPELDLNHSIKGAAGVAVTGAEGAVDRITEEILQSVEAGETLVVWFFDRSGSLQTQRKAVNARFARVYEELGAIEASGNEAFRRHVDKPLLTSVVTFGAKVGFPIKQPTDDLKVIQEAVGKIELDESGDERVFTAIREAVQRYRKYRTEEHRNLMFIVFTDEAGNDQEALDATVDLCRRFAISVYVVGVPAPFGRRETLVKWVDPDPKYDQTPQFGQVEQGPESLLPERIQLPLIGVRESESPIDSGFGPFALTRLCFETGGIYFTVHPNRNTKRRVSLGETENYAAYFTAFFDPEVMKRYRPEYVSSKEYRRQATDSRMRSALLRAAEYSAIGILEQPRRRFVVRSEAAFANDLTEAQKAAAKLEEPLRNLLQILQDGESDRRKEIVPRWQAGYDLAIGRVLANKVRTEGYNTALAKAKRGLKFTDGKNNTWQLVGDAEISGGSRLDQEGQLARQYLERVVHDHPETPWAWLASRELDQPLGWQWREEFTQVDPPRNQVAANNNNPNPAPQDDQPRKLKPPAPRRPPPKL